MKVLIVHDKELGPTPSAANAGSPVRCDASFLRDAGGLGLYVAHLEAGLRERGVEVESLVFRERPEERPSRAGHHELPSFRYRRRPDIVASALRIVEEQRVDVVHLNSMPTLSPELVRRFDEVCPVVWTFHDVTPFCFHETRLRRDGSLCDRELGWGCVATGCHRPGSQGGFLRDLLRVAATSRHLELYRSLRRCLVPSRFLADLFVQHGVKRERVEVLPLFTRFAAPKAASPPPADEPPGILFVGRLTEGKGAPAFVRALTRLRERSWRARIVGDGEVRGALERAVDAAGLRERVVFEGVLDGEELGRAFRSCRLAVVPSLVPESFGLVGVEAMGFGLPVVAFDAGGVTEWLEHDRTGWLVARGDEPGLALGIERLLDDPGLRARMGTAARAAVEERFTAARHLDRLLEVYGELCP